MALQDVSGTTPDSIIANRYRLDAIVGATTRTEVWTGHDTILARPVNIKFIYAGTPSIGSVRLQSPGIVAIFDIVEHNGLPVVITESVEAIPLDRLLETKTELRLDQVVYLLESVAHILVIAHKAGIPHGALSPSNILVKDDGSVLLTDFRGTQSRVPQPFNPSTDLEQLINLLHLLVNHCKCDKNAPGLELLLTQAFDTSEGQYPDSLLEFRMILQDLIATIELPPEKTTASTHRRLSTLAILFLVATLLGTAVFVTTALLGQGWALLGWE